MKFYGDYVLYPVIGLLLLATLTFTIITHYHTGRIYPLEVETLAIPADPVTVEQGRQLVEAYHCAECHGADLAGKRISEDLRMGKISASNLTGGKGGVQSLNSDTDWVRAIRHGIHRSGRPLLLMPSDQYFELGDEDLAAMIAYACALGWSMAYVGAVAMYGERRETLRHEALAQTIGDLVLRQDRDGSVVYASKEALVLFGLTPRDLMGRGMFERIHVADRPAFLSAIADALAGNATVACQVRLRRGALAEQDQASTEPNFAWIELRTHNLPQERRASDPNDHAAVVTIVRDVTRQRQAEEDIIHAREHAEQANVWKDRFLANVSHELRTPLNAIIGFAEILTNEDIVPTDVARRKEYAQIIHSSGHHLLEVVNSILDVSKIDAGSFDIVTEPFALPPLLDQCCDMIGLKATQANVQIVRDYPRNMDELVADKRACKQIVINLMSNAVKFTQPGGTVTLTARPEGNSFVLSVSDTGIGIDAKDLKHLGDPFFQAHNSTTRPYEGTGLGLSLVRGLVGLHGGSISVESVIGQGTTVTIRLPAHCATAHGGSRLGRIETFARRGGAPVLQQTHTEVVKKIA